MNIPTFGRKKIPKKLIKLQSKYLYTNNRRSVSVSDVSELFSVIDVVDNETTRNAITCSESYLCLFFKSVKYRTVYDIIGATFSVIWPVTDRVLRLLSPVTDTWVLVLYLYGRNERARAHTGGCGVR